MHKMNEQQVSIVIVCMNNLKNLYPCLDSISKYTHVSYETLVVAYLFSKENLERLKRDYSWIRIIESNEIRGFSENNNLALWQARGQYCYVLNDDTIMDSPVIDRLVETIQKQEDTVAVVSPNIKYPDGRPQFCGRNKATFWTFLKASLNMKVKDSQYKDKKGCFETYNIMGAAFLIRTEIFKSIGWFDEYYFFCPEDIAVSTTLNNRGYKCIGNGDIVQYHIQGASSSSVMQIATKPAHIKGSIVFYSGGSTVKKMVLCVTFVLRSILRAFIWGIIFLFTKKEKGKVKALMYINVIKGILSSATPKELFVENYTKIKNNQHYKSYR